MVSPRSRGLNVNLQEVVHSIRFAKLMSPNLSDSRGTNRMDTHNNARLTPRGREDMVRAVVDRGLSKAEAARQFNASWKTVDKWVNRFRTLGVEGLRDRSSRPHSLPSQTPLATADAVEACRRDRHTQSHIAAALGLSTATVSRICKAPASASAPSSASPTWIFSVSSFSFSRSTGMLWPLRLMVAMLRRFGAW